MAQDRLSILVSLEGADASLKQAIASARQGLQQFGGEAKKSGEAARRSFAGIDGVVQRLRGQLLGMAGAVASIAGARQIIDLAESYKQLQARLQLVTSGQKEFRTALEGTFDIAQRLGAPVQETATLYGRVQQAVRGLGRDQRDALRLTETVGKALRISGAGASESAAAMLQFGQALSSGVLRGDEFNSIMENAPRLAQALAEGLDVSTGRLRQMAQAGQLSADVVTGALAESAATVDAEFARLPPTIGQAFARLANAFGRFVAQADGASGATAGLARAVQFVADHFDAFAKAAAVLAAGALLLLAQRALPALTLALEAAAWSAAEAALAIGTRLAVAFKAATLPIEFATAVLGRFNVALTLVGSAVAGFQVGQMLREQFVPVQQIGDWIGAGLGAAAQSMRAFQGLVVRLFSGDVTGAARQFALDVRGIKTAWDDTTAAIGLSGKGLADMAQIGGASLRELQARIAAVRLGLGEAVGTAQNALADASQKLSAALSKLDNQINQSQSAVKAALSDIAAVRSQQTAAIDAALQARDAQWQQQARALQVALEAGNTAMRDAITQQNALLVQQTQERTSQQEQATVQTLALLSKEDAARLASAAAEGRALDERRGKVLAVEGDILQGRLAVWQQAATAYQQHIHTLIGEEQRHVLAVAQLEQTRLGINAGIEDKIRELRRQTMGADAALDDRRTEAAQRAAQARVAIAAGEFDKARQYAEQSQRLYETIGMTRGQESAAIDGLRQAQTLLNQAIDGEQKAHQQAAVAAQTARASIEQQLATARQQVEDLNRALTGVHDLKISADTGAAQQAFSELAKLIPERDTLIKIGVDLTSAQTALTQLDADIKAGREVKVGAEVSAARAALAELQTVADRTADIDLKVGTASALSAVDDVVKRIEALNTLQTASRHVVTSNAEQARRDIDSLQGRNTTSTHTITVRQVEAHAAGGVVGVLSGAWRRLAGGGRVAGPGTETSDSIPALLSRGEFVVRAAAVRQVGVAFLDAINSGMFARAPRLAAGGLVDAAPQPATTGTAVHLHFGSQSVGPLVATDDMAAQLRQAALMFGAR